MSDPHWYTVTSVPYDYTEPILDDGSGPTETTCDYIMVRATNRRRALVLAVRAWRRGWSKFGRRSGSKRLTHDKPYCVTLAQDGMNPFGGVRAKRLRPEDVIEDDSRFFTADLLPVGGSRAIVEDPNE